MFKIYSLYHGILLIMLEQLYNSGESNKAKSKTNDIRQQPLTCSKMLYLYSLYHNNE